MTEPRRAPGTVYLVGAGPGEPGLLTLRAAECLGRADLVLHDYLSNPALLEHARPGAELVRLGRHEGGGRTLEPDAITERMVAAALAGRTVVRLKSGDPSIFGRAGDEAEALRAAGIPLEIVPGVTSGLSVAAFAEIPLTHHEDAPAVALVTARERSCKDTRHLDWAALARFPGTLVLYMGVKEAGEWSRALLENGKPADTPVAVVRWASRARQRTVRCTLDTVAAVVEARGIRPPSLFVVGSVVDRAPALSWFEARPLFGTTVLVSGAASTASRLRSRLAERGAEVVVEPALRVIETPDPAALDDALDRLPRCDWLVFTSPNGVDGLLRRHFARGGDARAFGWVRIAAMGSGTAAALERWHLRADLVPRHGSPDALARVLVGERGGRRFLLAKAVDDAPALSEALRAAGAVVEEVGAYATREVEAPGPDLAEALEAGEVHWVAVTSATTARSLVRLHGEGLRRARLASIGPVTTDALRELGFPPAVEASPHTIDGLLEAVEREAVEAAAVAGARGEPAALRVGETRCGGPGSREGMETAGRKEGRQP